MRKLPFIALGLLVALGCGHRSGDSKPVEGEDEEIELIDLCEPEQEHRCEVMHETDEVLVPEDLGPETAPPSESQTTHRPSRTPYAKNIGRYDEIFNDSNYIQYAAAERLGIDPIYTLFDAYNTRRPLVKIESGDNYFVDNLTHSMPYLVPEAASLLNEIGDDFGRLVEERGGDRADNQIIVTSVLRSPYTVKKLRRVNRNAVDSSTHMFGTTFDLAWNNFHYPDSAKAVNAGVLKGILAEVLLKKRNEGRCYVKYEKKTPCFHITVNK